MTYIRFPAAANAQCATIASTALVLFPATHFTQPKAHVSETENAAPCIHAAYHMEMVAAVVSKVSQQTVCEVASHAIATIWYKDRDQLE